MQDRTSFLVGALIGGAASAAAVYYWTSRTNAGAAAAGAAPKAAATAPAAVGGGTGSSSNAAGGAAPSAHGVADFDKDDILMEQLTRNVQFFGLEAQKKIANSFVVVVGLGVSGSVCAARRERPVEPPRRVMLTSMPGRCIVLHRRHAWARTSNHKPSWLQGVGSHAAHMLLRSGVGRLRLVDFDQVGGFCSKTGIPCIDCA